MNSDCGKNIDIFNIKARGLYSYHSTSKGQVVQLLQWGKGSAMPATDNAATC
jgi:hypothetical protein